jgi:hypothetical protein
MKNFKPRCTLEAAHDYECEHNPDQAMAWSEYGMSLMEYPPNSHRAPELERCSFKLGNRQGWPVTKPKLSE